MNANPTLPRSDDEMLLEFQQLCDAARDATIKVILWQNRNGELLRKNGIVSETPPVCLAN